MSTYRVYRVLLALLASLLPVLAHAQQVVTAPTPIDALLKQWGWVLAKWFLLFVIPLFALYIVANKWWQKYIKQS